METQNVFRFEGFYIERDGDYNVSLYRDEKVPVMVEGSAGRGKGRGIPTGEYKIEKVHKGFYSSFMGAFGSAVERLAEEGKDISDLIKVMERLETLKKNPSGLESAIVQVEKRKSKKGGEDEVTED